MLCFRIVVSFVCIGFVATMTWLGYVAYVNAKPADGMMVLGVWFMVALSWPVGLGAMCMAWWDDGI